MNLRSLFQIHHLLPLLLLLSGCREVSEPPSPQADTAPASLGAHFDSSQAGTVVGQVRWQGTRPAVPEWVVPPSYLFGALGTQQTTVHPNPNAPQLDKQGGIGNAVVYLRQVDPAQARPWPHSPVRVELRNDQLEVEQDGATSRVGFVQAGETIEMVSREPTARSVRARGSAFYTLALPHPHQPRRRHLGQRGMVEITEGTGRHWLRADLFVVAHPYYARSQPNGEYQLQQVPPGRYELVAWMPSWLVNRIDRETESLGILRAQFRLPIELTQIIQVPPCGTVRVDFAFCTALFE